MMQGETGLAILERRQVTLGWANDPVWGHDGRKGRG